MPLDPDEFDGRIPDCDWCCEPAEHVATVARVKPLLLCDPCYKFWEEFHPATGDEPIPERSMTNAK